MAWIHFTGAGTALATITGLGSIITGPIVIFKALKGSEKFFGTIFGCIVFLILFIILFPIVLMYVIAQVIKTKP